MITKMLNKRLEVDHESTQAYELLKFIRSQVQNTNGVSIASIYLVLPELVNTARRKINRQSKSHEVVMEKDSKVYRGKKERVMSISLKAKKESSDDETSTSGSDD
ncbi:hypothetical protein Tco_0310221 [Tanacetum coccineum]